MTTERWRHSPLLIFTLGGVLGTGLNAIVTFSLVALMRIDPAAAFFVGTFANQAFHFVYFNVVYVNQEVRMKPIPVQVGLAVATSLLAACLLQTMIHGVGLSFGSALVASLGLLAALSVALIRACTFRSSSLAEIEYKSVGESFYDDQTDPQKVGQFRAWYHRSRYEQLKDLVHRTYRPGMEIADLGCGNCWWNTDGLPVVGVDTNEAMLKWAKSHGRVTDFVLNDDLTRTKLPALKFDIVVMSEVLEHVLDHPGVLREVARILKDDGVFIVTVPWDFFLGPFFVMFNLQCLYMGYVKGSRYHMYRCGHIHHFTRSRLTRTLTENGFDVKDLFVVNRLLIYGRATKSTAGR